MWGWVERPAPARKEKVMAKEEGRKDRPVAYDYVASRLKKLAEKKAQKEKKSDK